MTKRVYKNLQKNMPFNKKDPQNYKTSFATQNRSEANRPLCFTLGLDGIKRMSGNESQDCGGVSQEEVIILWSWKFPENLQPSALSPTTVLKSIASSFLRELYNWQRLSCT